MLRSIKTVMDTDEEFLKLRRKRRKGADHPSKDQLLAIKLDWRDHPEWTMEQLSKHHCINEEKARARLLRAMRIKERP